MIKRHYDNTELLDYVENDKNTKTLENKEILLHFNSFCLGDTICFASFMDQFVDYHKPKKVLVSTFFPHLLKSNNDKYEFINANQKKRIIVDKHISVGYDKEDVSHTLGGMMYATKDTMMIPQSTKPIKPSLIKKERKIINNKITHNQMIAMSKTNHFKICKNSDNELVRLAEIRMALSYFLYMHCPLRLTEIAPLVGYKDHSTMSIYRKRIEFYIQTEDPKFFPYYLS